MDSNKIKKGLGRGLSSLIGDSDLKTSTNKISISSIIPNKNQPRKLFEKEALEELTNSIKERGIIQPLIVRKTEDQIEKIGISRTFKSINKSEIVLYLIDLASTDRKIDLEINEFKILVTFETKP